VEVRAPGQSVRHVALLPAFTTTEGLTHAVLALFSPKEVMPACYMPVGLLRDEKNRYIYGRWHIKAIHWINNEEYLVWLQAGGGDGGWHWQLQTFMTITSSCGEVNRVDYYVDVDPPETCKLSVPRLDGFFSVALDGKVVSRPVKKSCLGIRVERM
jgi:hypothetical protein